MNKKLNIFCGIIILCNHHFIFLKLFWAIMGFILYQINQKALKSGYNFTTYNKFTYTSWIEDLQTRNLSLLFGPLVRKQQATGFEPLRNIFRPSTTFTRCKIPWPLAWPWLSQTPSSSLKSGFIILDQQLFLWSILLHWLTPAIITYASYGLFPTLSLPLLLSLCSGINAANGTRGPQFASRIPPTVQRPWTSR